MLDFMDFWDESTTEAKRAGEAPTGAEPPSEGGQEAPLLPSPREDHEATQPTQPQSYLEHRGATGPLRAEARRRERAKRRRHRLLLAALTVAVLLVLAGTVTAALGAGSHLPLVGGLFADASSQSSTSSTTAAGQAGASTTAVTPTTGTQVDATVTPGTTDSTSTTVDRGPAGPPVSLTVKVAELTANVLVQSPGGGTQKGKTPFKVQVPSGKTTVTLTRSGYNTIVRDVDLTKDTALTFWLDPGGLLLQSLIRFKSGSMPKQVAFSPDGKELWVTLLGGRGVEIYDPYTGKLLDSIKLGTLGGAVEVIFTKDGRTVYASQMESGSVFEIDRTSREVQRQIFTEGTWTKVMALSPDEKTLYAANWTSNDVSVINLASGEVVKRLKTVNVPRGLFVTKDGKRLFVCGYELGQLQRIDLTTGKSDVLLDTGGALRHMVANQAGTLLYFDDMAKFKTWVVDVATEKVTALAATDPEPNTLDLSPDGKVLFVSCRGKNGDDYMQAGPEWGSVVLIDTATGKMLDAVVGGNQPTGLDVSPDGKYLAFSDFLDDRIRVFRIPSYETLANGGGGRSVSHLAELPKKQ
jgi:YVTN family beta-propeller protein